MDIRAGKIHPGRIGVRRVTIGAANIVAPVFAATEVVPLFLAGMAGKTSLSRFFRRFILERNDLGGVAFGDVVLSGTMTGFASGDLALPTANLGKLGMRSVRVSFELIFVTILAGFATDIICRVVACWFDLGRLNGLRSTARGEPHDRSGQRDAKERRLDDSV